MTESVCIHSGMDKPGALQGNLNFKSLFAGPIVTIYPNLFSKLFADNFLFRIVRRQMNKATG